MLTGVVRRAFTLLAVGAGVALSRDVSGVGGSVKVIRAAVCAIGTAAAVGLAGCSTVVRTENAAPATAASAERDAIGEAARGLAATPWPKPQNASLIDRMTGEADGAQPRVSRSQAVDAYEAVVLGRIDPFGALVEDARGHLDAARSLAAAADVAADAGAARMNDVDLVEQGIAALREARGIYLDVFERIDGDREARRALKRDFDAAIESLGDAADRLADTAMREDASFMAGPGSMGRAGAM